MWIIIVLLGLLVGIQVFFFTSLIRILSLLKSAPGKPGVQDIPPKVVETMEAVHRATSAVTEFLNQIRPAIEQAAIVSKRQLSHAEQVVGEVLGNVERINKTVHNVAEAVQDSFTEAHALSAGVRSGTATLFRKANNSNKRKQW